MGSLNNPKVSVLMPNYNGERYLAEAIESILNQTFADFEFIIIDDASTDKSWEIIQDYATKDQRIIALRNEKNLGVHKTRNRLLKKAVGDYFALMDSDDLSHKDRLIKQISFLDKNIDYSLCGSNFFVIDGDGVVVGEKVFPEKDIDIKLSFFFRNPFGQNTVIFRKECVEELGGYDESLEVAEDLDLWIRFGVRYKMYNIQENLVFYRIHGQNSILTKQKLHIKNTLLLRKKAFALGYKMNFKAKIFYVGTWCMQFFPSKFVLWLFNFLNKK